jgi:hypothetical protein
MERAICTSGVGGGSVGGPTLQVGPKEDGNGGELLADRYPTGRGQSPTLR